MTRHWAEPRDMSKCEYIGSVVAGDYAADFYLFDPDGEVGPKIFTIIEENERWPECALLGDIVRNHDHPLRVSMMLLSRSGLRPDGQAHIIAMLRQEEYPSPEEREAIIEQDPAYFERYIAGDR